MRTRIRRRQALGAQLVFALALGGCDGSPLSNPSPSPTSSPATQAAPAPAKVISPLVDGWDAWSAEEAIERLADERARLSAAVRLIRLAGAEPLIAPDPLPARLAGTLRVVAVDDETWLLGRQIPNSSGLASPLIVKADGEVLLLVTGAEEEAAIAYLSEDADRFPHLMVTPLRVAILRDAALETALTVQSIPGLRFALKHEDGATRLTLRLRDPSQLETVGDEPPKADVAEYRWDRLEEMFLGPAADLLPDPPGGRFDLDLAASPLLIPIGGEIPAPPEPLEPPPDLPPPY